jgi:alkanesulfonate monooxygenase SsuD/methylene tetrahydromethanopterin reductase-like flavin-dependent oxidoreductase (luciferase family)
MRFGLFGGPVRQAGETADSPAYFRYVDTVMEAERLGFYGAYLVEHHFTGRGQVSASLGLLTYLAGLTSRIRLGTAVVVVPWHNPVLLAEQSATLDLLSEGRLDLGLGRGYRDYEFEGFGIPRTEAQARFDETLDFLRTAWRADTRFSFHGEFWQFSDIVIEPKPAQQPHPPVWIGAASEQSITRAAEQGLRLYLDQVATLAELEQRVGWYREAQARAGVPGSNHDIAVTRPLLLADDGEHRTALLEGHLATLESLASSTANSTDNPFFSDPSRRREIAEDGAIVGEPDECIERLRQFAAIGIHSVLFTRTTPQSLRRFSETVLPAFDAHE